MGDINRALNSFVEALRLLQSSEEKHLIAECFAGIGSVLLKKGDTLRAVRLMSASKALLDALDEPLEAVDQTQYDLNLADARDRLDGSAWTAAWMAGQTLSLDTVISEVLNGS
jgi:hypothetical protein